MSASPKIVELMILGAALAGIEAFNRSRASRAELERHQAAVDSYSQQQAQQRGDILRDAEELQRQLRLAEDELPGSEAVQIHDGLAGIVASLRQGSAEGGMLADYADSVVRLRMRFQELASTTSSRRFAELGRTRDRFSAELEELTGELQQLRSMFGDGQPLPLNKAEEALGEARAALSSTDSARIEQLVSTARAAVSAVSRQAADQLAQQARQAQQAREQLARLDQVVAGLKADETVMRWQGRAVQQLAQTADQLRAARVTDAAELQRWQHQFEQDQQQIVAAAHDAQLQADKRDYIANSLRAVLADMGFVTSEAVAEHAGHPASAVVFNAANAAGQGISISVPVEGEVWYDVAGYPKRSESMAAGGVANTCDEAEDVLEQMHDALEQAFNIKAGELSWEGKDPNRRLRQADDLPSSGESRSREDT